MSEFMSKITAFIAMLLCFLGSLGIGQQQSVPLVIMDGVEAEDEAYVYYLEEGKKHETAKYVLIGKTDENGKVLWEKPVYGDVKIYVTETESTLPIENEDVKCQTITVSRFSAEEIIVTLAD